VSGVKKGLVGNNTIVSLFAVLFWDGVIVRWHRVLTEVIGSVLELLGYLQGKSIRRLCGVALAVYGIADGGKVMLI